MFAVTVNNRGEIVGSGLFTDGTVNNFVLIPVHGTDQAALGTAGQISCSTSVKGNPN